MNEARKELLGRLMRMQALMHRYQAQNFMNFGPWGNPHRGQGRILTVLKMKPEISQKELSYLLDMSKQAMAELLNKLEKNGYITRETSDEDRRSFNIKLTEAGAAAANGMDTTPPEVEKILGCLSDEELANMNDYLKRINNQIEEQLTCDVEELRRQMKERFMERGRNFGGHGGGFPGPFGGGFPGRFGGGFSPEWGCGHGCEEKK